MVLFEFDRVQEWSVLIPDLLSWVSTRGWNLLMAFLALNVVMNFFLSKMRDWKVTVEYRFNQLGETHILGASSHVQYLSHCGYHNYYT